MDCILVAQTRTICGCQYNIAYVRTR